jgi:hypothetical protein
MNRRLGLALLGVVLLAAALLWWSQSGKIRKTPAESPQASIPSSTSSATPAEPAVPAPSSSTPNAAPAPAATPAPAPAPESRSGDSSCCEVVVSSELKGRLGRLVVTFPEGVKAGNTRIDVFRPADQTSLAGGYGGHTFDLLPGTYDVEVSKKRIIGVPIKSAHDTRVRVGVLRVSAGKNTRVDVLDATGKENLTGGYGNQEFGLPVGPVQVKVAGQAETVSIQDGKVTEF